MYIRAMEQWKVECGDYTRTFMKKQGAKRDYGQWSKEIEEEEEGLVQLFWRADIKEEWVLVEEFGYKKKRK
jgi:hypothetical protein